MRSAEHLRNKLDMEGGRNIGLDFVLMLPYKVFVEQAHLIVQKLHSTPCDNIILRLSGFGAHAGPLMVKSVFQSLPVMHALNKPIVLDYLGGLVGQSSIALNLVSGLSHGIAERTRFDTRDWNKTPKPRDSEDSRGRAVRIPLPHLDRTLLRDEVDIIAKTVKGQRALGCEDKNCCAHGLKSLLEDPRAHCAFQAVGEMESINKVPNAHRAQHFHTHQVREAERKARDLEALSTGDESLDKRFSNERKKIDSLSRVLEAITNDLGGIDPPPRVIKRVNKGPNHQEKSA